MSLALVVYPPGAGGNHLKNLLCLDVTFHNSAELDPAVYDAQDRARGEVWCVGGRNLQPVFFDRLEQDPDARFVLIAHFGEMMQNRQRILEIDDIRLVIITITDPAARRRLEQRQTRLGQNIHPYWLDEELTWCYQSQIYQDCFGISRDRCLEVPLQDLWHPDLPAVPAVEQFLAVTIPRDQARLLHQKWLRSNFH